MPLYDYRCDPCDSVIEVLRRFDDPAKVICESCGAERYMLMPCPPVITNIVVDYPGSKKFKAGYVHSHGDRPAEKISVSVPALSDK